MVLPILAGLVLVTVVGTGRAALRAYRRLQAMPPEMFAAKRNAERFDGSIYKTPFLPGGFLDKMTYSEALQILELPPGATKTQILEQHRTVMRLNHPDMGGSTYFATKINEARDVLLQHAK